MLATFFNFEGGNIMKKFFKNFFMNILIISLSIIFLFILSLPSAFIDFMFNNTLLTLFSIIVEVTLIMSFLDVKLLK